MNWIKELLEYLTSSFRFWITVNPWEEGLRIRFGKHVKHLKKGIHFKLPFFDSVYCQTIRQRVIMLSPQTVSTSDNKTLTVSASLSYSISSIEKLYHTLYHPNTTLSNIVKGEISSYISSNKLEDCTQSKINIYILESLKATDYGMEYQYVKLLTFAVVKTFRLIKDSEWTEKELEMDVKH